MAAPLFSKVTRYETGEPATILLAPAVTSFFISKTGTLRVNNSELNPKTRVTPFPS